MKAKVKAIPISYAISSLNLGGAEKQLFYLLNGIDRCQYLPEVIAYGDGYWRERIKELNIPVFLVDYAMGRLLAIYHTYKYLRRHRPLILHTMGFSANMVARLAGTLARIPIIVVGERSAPSVWDKRNIILERVLSRYAKAYLTNSVHAAEFLVQHHIVPAEKISVIPNCIEVSSYPVAKGSESGLELAYIGNFRKGKNHFFLLDAAQRMIAAIPGLKLHLIGEGSMRSKIEARIDKLGISDNVILHGFVKEPQYLMQKFDIYVHVSEYEGFPNAIMEAMACSLPCIAVNNTGCAELIDHNVNGLLYPSNDIKAFIQAVRHLLFNKHFAHHLGERGRHKMQHLFGVERMCNSNMEIYRNCIVSIDH